VSLSKTVVVLCSELSISDQNQLTQSACKPLKNGIEYKFLNASELDCELENHCTGNRTGGANPSPSAATGRPVRVPSGRRIVIDVNLEPSD